MLKDSDSLDVSEELGAISDDFGEDLDLCLDAPVVPYPLKIELESPHREMVKNVRERLERSLGRVTDHGLEPLGEITELGGQDRSLADLLTGSILQTPHLNGGALPAFSPFPEKCASPGPPTNHEPPVPPCVPKAAILKTRTIPGKKTTKRQAKELEKSKNIVGPQKKRTKPAHFTFDGI
eukprot:CAMPEP_0197290988 /NCGR_PEP_ID=MMETSP0890-20130614/10455_1 /TAXON_ID=44058 ORGANISM="Aureoumbra lagunensis, Strain CCMP1510" /NCGR_SAMPLE_ID=MMETSP0890 /ASSEMBLY_ACC=CAM_ASM_000533 /LENGTH=179 /DNA_ID=CAMNT_0042763413 /DNA_START=102 /DNA_END=641 /DNA_ORIENTATION=+